LNLPAAASPEARAPFTVLPGRWTIRHRILVATSLVAAALASGCTSGAFLSAGPYAEPTLFSCGYLRGDTAQDQCHVSLYRVPPDQRSGDLVEEVADANQLESP